MPLIIFESRTKVLKTLRKFYANVYLREAVIYVLAEFVR